MMEEVPYTFSYLPMWTSDEDAASAIRNLIENFPQQASPWMKKEHGPRRDVVISRVQACPVAVVLEDKPSELRN